MSRFVSITLALWLAVAAIIVPANGVRAQPPDDQLGESLGFVILFPPLRTLPAPTWFVPGVRVSYDSISANFQGGGAGQGMVQYDVAGVDAGWAMVSTQSFIDNGAGALIPTGPSPKVGLPAVGEFWIHPTVLVNAETVTNQNLSVTRFNKVFMGQTFQIVRFQSQTAGGGRTVWEFDAAGGLLMFYSQELDGVSASQLQVRNFRTVALPTQGARAPNWVRPGAQLLHTGTQVQTIPGAGQIPAPYAVTTEILGATGTWSVQGQQMFLNNTPVGSGMTATGVGTIFGGLWLPREALARIVAQETVIDQDPDTGAQLRVGRTDTNYIFLRETNQAYQTILYYHPTLGYLEHLEQTILSALSTTQIQIDRTGGSDLEALNSLPELAPSPPAPDEIERPDPASDQEAEIELPASTLTLGIPGDFVDMPVDVAVNVVLGPPPPPVNGTPWGDPFALIVTDRNSGDPVTVFARPVTLQIQLPEVAPSSDGGTPLFHHLVDGAWQPLDSDHDASAQTVSASHNRSGVYAVFRIAEPGDEDPDEENPDDEEPEEQEFTNYLPALQR
jgi:hypothetical protein